MTNPSGANVARHTAQGRALLAAESGQGRTQIATTSYPRSRARCARSVACMPSEAARPARGAIRERIPAHSTTARCGGGGGEKQAA